MFEMGETQQRGKFLKQNEMEILKNDIAKWNNVFLSFFLSLLYYNRSLYHINLCQSSICEN